MLKIYFGKVDAIDLNARYPLSEYRSSRLNKQVSDSKKRECIGVELLLNHALGETYPEMALPADILCLKEGKPVLADGRIHFSLSHSGGYAACAVSDMEIGMDIQKAEKYRERLAERFFSEKEKTYIASAKDRDYAFTKLWCMKESYIKALGTGLSTPLNSFCVLDMQGIFHTEIDGLHLAVCVAEAQAIIVDKIEEIVIPDGVI